jgi:hypothetical protein
LEPQFAVRYAKDRGYNCYFDISNNVLLASGEVDGEANATIVLANGTTVWNTPVNDHRIAGVTAKIDPTTGDVLSAYVGTTLFGELFMNRSAGWILTCRHVYQVTIRTQMELSTAVADSIECHPAKP